MLTATEESLQGWYLVDGFKTQASNPLPVNGAYGSIHQRDMIPNF